jgi:large subunit ribosomal protein L10
MANAQKIATVTSLVDIISKYGVLGFVDYSKITHQQLEALRKELKKQNGTIRVVKNSLLLRALSDSGIAIEGLSLTGETAVVFSGVESFAPLKTVYEKGKELDSLSYKGGVWEQSFVSSDQIIRLATMPSKQELIARLLGQLSSPQVRLVYSLKSTISKFILTVNHIKETRTVS